MTLLSIQVGTQTAGGAGVVYSRNCKGSTTNPNPLLCHEERVQLDTNNPTFRFGGSRGHYEDFSNNFPSASTNNDKLFNRLPLISFKYNSGSTLWTDIGSASPTVNTAIYNRIVTVGNQIKTWQDANAGVGKWGCTFMWSFHHEPNNESGQGGTLALQSAGWRAAFVNILDIWRTMPNPVRFWQGGNNLSTTTEGIIPIICLVSGISSGHPNDIQTYWGNNADMNRLCKGYMGDPYNIGTHFRPFSNINSDLKAWSDAKTITQNAIGYPHLQGVWETGTRDTNGYTDADASWLASYGAPNKVNWYAQASNYLKTSYTQCAVFAYYDDAPANSNQPDQTQASWNSWLTNFCTADFDIATSPIPGGSPPPPPPPPPPGDYFPGVVEPGFRAKIGA